MKNKYQRLTREEKKAAIKEYRSVSERNDNYIRILNRMLVLGIIGVVYGIVSVVTDFIFTFTSVFNYIVDGIVLIFSTFLIVNRNKIVRTAINNYLIDKANSTNDTKKVEKKETKKKTAKKTK